MCIDIGDLYIFRGWNLDIYSSSTRKYIVWKIDNLIWNGSNLESIPFLD